MYARVLGRTLAVAPAVGFLLLFPVGLADAQLPVAPSCNPATIAGTARDGETLTARRGSCSGAPTPTVTLQWFLCNAALDPPSCTARTRQMQTSSLAYTVQPGDVNGRLVVQQIARNNFGTHSDDTPTDVVAAVPPSATPAISGTPRVGEPLAGSEGFLSGTRPSIVGVQWLRCQPDGGACDAIPGATNTGYLLTADDAGSTIRFEVTVQGPQHTVDVQSAPTDPIGSIPPSPQPPGPAPTPRRPAAPRPLQPFPTIVIAGRAFPQRAVVSTLLVRGPRGARVTITCRGAGCPARRLRRRIRRPPLRLRRFERSLGAGTVIEIRVTSSNRIGKFTRLRILGDRPPARTDLCVTPGRRRPVRCPRGVG